MSGKILHLCADLGSDSKPYKDAGYDVILVGKDIGVENYNPPSNIVGVIANPVCTEFSLAQGKHIQRDTEKGMFLVNHCIRIIKESNPQFWVIENPATGRLKEFLGKPRMSYEPWQFGSPWTKRTSLWGFFNKPDLIYSRWEDCPKNKDLYVQPGRPKPSLAKLHYSAKQFIREFDSFNVDNDSAFRSLCSQGFAREFFNANNPLNLPEEEK